MSVEVTHNSEVAVAETTAPSRVETVALLSSAALKDALTWVGVATNRPPVPVLTAARFDVMAGELFVSAFNYDERVAVYLGPVDGPDVSVLVPQASALAVVKGIAGTRKASAPEVLLVMAEGHLTIGDTGANLAWSHKELADYPQAPNDPMEHGFTAHTETLVAAFDRLKVSASSDDTLPILTSACLELSAGYAVGTSTDRYRLTRLGIDGTVSDAEVKLLVPMRKWAKIKRMLKAPETVMHYGGGRVRFTSGAVSVSMLLVDGDYPKIRALFPDDMPNVVTVDRKALLAAVTAASLVTTRNIPLRLNFEGQSIRVSAEVEGAGVVTCGHAIYSGFTEIEAQAFNPGYLLDALKALTGDHVVFGQTTPPRPVVLAGSIEDLGFELAFNYLLMPVRLPSN